MNPGLEGLLMLQQKRLSCSSNCSSKPSEADSKCNSRNELQSKINTMHATLIWIKSSLDSFLWCMLITSYIPRFVHGLFKNDTQRRLQYCKLFINECRYSSDIVIKMVCWGEGQTAWSQ
jgi:hypothetical protein